MIVMTPGLLRTSPLLARAVCEVLTETARRIKAEGFTQGQFWNSATGKYCTRGMYTQVVFDRYRGQNVQIDGVNIWRSVIDACDMVLTMHLGSGVACWNDVPGRTREEVVTVLTDTSEEVMKEALGL